MDQSGAGSSWRRYLFLKEDYEGRMARLWEMPQAEGYDTIVIYGDREHFSNVDYFTGYDARWEETLLILPRHGRPGILVGNEGIGYVKKVPVEIDVEFIPDLQPHGAAR